MCMFVVSRYEKYLFFALSLSQIKKSRSISLFRFWISFNLECLWQIFFFKCDMCILVSLAHILMTSFISIWMFYRLELTLTRLIQIVKHNINLVLYVRRAMCHVRFVESWWRTSTRSSSTSSSFTRRRRVSVLLASYCFLISFRMSNVAFPLELSTL